MEAFNVGENEANLSQFVIGTTALYFCPQNSLTDEVEDPQLIALAEGAAQLARSISLDTNASDDSDVDSLQSFHFSPKAVDYPSALRLAKRLYLLEGFKKSDVSRHLSKK